MTIKLELDRPNVSTHSIYVRSSSTRIKTIFFFSHPLHPIDGSEAVINRCQRKAMSLFSLRGLAHDDDIQKFFFLNGMSRGWVYFVAMSFLLFSFRHTSSVCQHHWVYIRKHNNKKKKIKRKQTTLVTA